MKRILINSFLIVICFLLVDSLFAQGGKKRRGEPSKTISPADKAVIIDIFRSLDPQYFYLECERGSEVYGTKTLVSADNLESIRKEIIPAGSDHLIIGPYYYQMGIVFIIGKTRSGTSLETILGKTNATKLQAIINKYTGG
jgi:hypothetical protein